MKETGLYDDYYIDYKTTDMRQVLEGKLNKLLPNPEERKRVGKVIHDTLPYYFAQMALLGLDARNLIKKLFPKATIKALNENNPLELEPYVPEDLKEATLKKFLEIKAREPKSS